MKHGTSARQSNINCEFRFYKTEFDYVNHALDNRIIFFCQNKHIILNVCFLKLSNLFFLLNDIIKSVCLDYLV